MALIEGSLNQVIKEKRFQGIEKFSVREVEDYISQEVIPAPPELFKALKNLKLQYSGMMTPQDIIVYLRPSKEREKEEAKETKEKKPKATSLKQKTERLADREIVELLKRTSVENLRRKVEEGGHNLDELPDTIRRVLYNLNGDRNTLIGNFIKKARKEGTIKNEKKLIDELFEENDFLIKYRFEAQKDTEYGKTIDQLAFPESLRKYLQNKGINKLYEFQETAFNTITNGENAIIVAQTGNGKTEAFSLPILSKIYNEKKESDGQNVKAVFIYPTKALARDQFSKLKELGELLGISFDVFDGDTPLLKRLKIFQDPPDVLITNPDILHWHLRKRNGLRRIIRGVKFVVLDEIHTYKGAFGSNVYFILKRLRRNCGDFQLIGASATVGNAEEFAKELFDADAKFIKQEQGRHGDTHFLML